MESLPNEIIWHILSFLEPPTIVIVQRLSSRFLSLGRDEKLWKGRCFEESRYAANRRRQQLLSSQESSLDALRRAMNAVAQAGAAHGTANAAAQNAPTSGDDPLATLKRDDVKSKAIANWDPSYPTEKTNYYQEYIHRHAPLTLNWLQKVRDKSGDTVTERECMGIGVLEFGTSKVADKIISPLDDGTVGVWDVSYDHTNHGRLLARSAMGTLFDKHTAASVSITNETGAVDNVSIDSVQKKAYIAIAQDLHELDLNTLQVVQRQSFPFPITALSTADPNIPITIGTNMTLHLHDPRLPRRNSFANPTTHCELIGGTPPKADVLQFNMTNATKHVSLAQPGPLSILHLPTPGSSPSINDPIWVAGRFTSLLNYDRRNWPHIRSTIFSGARLSSLTSIPHPFIPRYLRQSMSSHSDLLDAKAQPGSTLIAAGEYKGKGSLELYTSPRDASRTSMAQEYWNRQTASASRLLSVAAHGMRLVFSDGDGNMKWVERDGSTLVHTFNINEHRPDRQFPEGSSRRVQASRTSDPRRDGQHYNSNPELDSEGGYHSGDENRRARQDIIRTEDIVQKIIATNPLSAGDSAAGVRNDLLVWTGDGKLGLVGFGNKEGEFGFEDGEEEGYGEGEKERIRRERRYADEMREALERHADEARFVRGFGLFGG